MFIESQLFTCSLNHVKAPLRKENNLQVFVFLYQSQAFKMKGTFTVYLKFLSQTPTENGFSKYT